MLDAKRLAQRSFNFEDLARLKLFREFVRDSLVIVANNKHHSALILVVYHVKKPSHIFFIISEQSDQFLIQIRPHYIANAVMTCTFCVEWFHEEVLTKHL
jgi:hypothetical protein